VRIYPYQEAPVDVKAIIQQARELAKGFVPKRLVGSPAGSALLPPDFIQWPGLVERYEPLQKKVFVFPKPKVGIGQGLVSDIQQQGWQLFRASQI